MRLLTAASLLFASPVLGLTEAEIQGFIDKAINAGGGEVVIPPGVHVIERGLMMRDAKKVRLAGLDPETCVLKLPPVAFAETAIVTPAGADRIECDRWQNLRPGMLLHIEAEGDLDSFTKKPKPYVLAEVKSIEGMAIRLKEPLKFRIPAQALIRDERAPNLIEVRGSSEAVRIEKLTLDGGRVAGDPPLRGHAQLCGVFAAGAYTYEKGPTGPRVKGLTVSRCIIRHCHGRGIALYSTEGAVIEDCTLMDTTDEAVDLDHFTVKATVRHNDIARSLVGIELNDATDCLVIANEVRDCKTGVNLWRWCRQPGLNQGNRIADNFFLGTTGNAVQIGAEAGVNVIERNEITRTGKNGIITNSEGQEIRENRVSQSGLKDVAGP